MARVCDLPTLARFRLTTAGLGLVACDLDGTLVRNDRTVSARAVASLQRLSAQAVPIVIMTARHRRSAAPTLAHLEVARAAILSNGALVTDGLGQEEMAIYPFNTIRLERLLGRCRVRLPKIAFGWETPDAIYREPALQSLYASRSPTAPHAELGTLDTLSALSSVVKATVGHPQLVGAALSRELDPVIGQRTTLKEAGGPFVDITAHGVTKARALQMLCRSWKIRRESVVAFGDHANDCEVLSWAGLGIAVRNADASALAVADAITDSNEEDGVAKVLERL